MNRLREGLQQYFALRSRLGFELRDARHVLDKFMTFLDGERASHITTILALRWATQPVGVSPASSCRRFQTIRRFAVWFSNLDPQTEVPPQGLLPYRYHRQRPYIYSPSEIEQLLQATALLPSPGGFRGCTYSTLFGLLAVTGMRVSEALSLDRQDVNLAEGVLLLRKTKFGKSRLVPLHPSTQAALRRYAHARDRFLPYRPNPAFFLLERGTRISKRMAEWTFAKVGRNVGLRPTGKNHSRAPRLHDMRHSFVARTLIDWYRAGLDVEGEIPKLVTYLGHSGVRGTYWYIEAVPELLQLATQRLESGRTGGGS